MAYLVRRLLENTSNEGFLKAKFSGHAPAAELLRDPALLAVAPLPDPSPTAMNTAFANEPPIDFTVEKNRAKMRAALASVRGKFGKEYAVQIGERSAITGRWIESINPARPGELIGKVACAGVEHAQNAVEAASKAMPGWRATPVEQRAAIIEKLGGILRAERYELAALEVFEAGKPWVEADGDLAEAIDFCMYYASEMRRLAVPQPTSSIPGEASVQDYVPRGIGLVIAPWNFPLAILCGMTVAALVAGNPVILKPAEQTSVLAAWFFDCAKRAGLPPGVLNFLPGYGEEIGEALVNHPMIDFIAFTGSKEVGLKIWEAGGRTAPGQKQLKRVVCEMGGKNPLIIDSDADLDEAVAGALYSAFGYQGQKCSALSRLIVIEEVYDRLLERLVAAAACLSVGDPEAPGTVVGPVIDEEAFDRIQRYIGIGKSEARLTYEGKPPEGPGYFIAPVIFAEVPPTARIAREEIFGPVLCVLKARDLDEAIQFANDTDFALTAGLYSRSPANIARVRQELVAGNLYINRTITGAIVERHPFGGFKMSGGGTKAGGHDYLLNFLFPRVVTENVLRRGFAPAEA
jgi:RHH-type proline utilization regulon transcriptional repressor/proline dehydrogenase/delta 1-pyrroline-5-carboxylate dehydrogenase